MLRCLACSALPHGARPGPGGAGPLFVTRFLTSIFLGLPPLCRPPLQGQLRPEQGAGGRAGGVHPGDDHAGPEGAAAGLDGDCVIDNFPWSAVSLVVDWQAVLCNCGRPGGEHQGNEVYLQDSWRPCDRHLIAALFTDWLLCHVRAEDRWSCPCMEATLVLSSYISSQQLHYFSAVLHDIAQ